MGTRDLSDDPTAEAAPAKVLRGNTAGIPVLINEMNSRGTEYTPRRHLTRSGSARGGEVNVGGGGSELNDGNSSAAYDPPRVGHDNGPWTTRVWTRPSW